MKFPRLIFFKNPSNPKTAAYLMQPVESASIFSWWSRIVFWQSWNGIWINDLLCGFRCRTLCMMNLSTTEVPVLWAFQVQVVQHALVVDTLSGAAAKSENRLINLSFTRCAINSLFVVQVAAALVQAVRILSEFIVAALLNVPEEFESASCNRSAFA